MGNILRILKRDILRLLKTPPALVVICALLVIPSLYTWYNVRAFWNPYESTGNLRVEVVNQDEGGSSELTGQINIGELVVDALHENDQLKWEFTSLDDAMDLLESGEVFAAFVIPEDFTSNLLTITTGNFVKPDIQYYVNEKMGPVGPKITDTGASTLDEQINSTFVTTVSEAAVSAFDEALASANESKDEASSQASTQLGSAIADIDSTSASIADLKQTASDASGKISHMLETLSSVDASIEDAASALDEVAALARDLGQGLSAQTSGTGSATEEAFAETIDSLKRSLESLASTAESARSGVDGQHAMIGQAQKLTDDMQGTLASVVEALGQTDELLQGLKGELESAQADVIAIGQADIIADLFGDDSQDGLDPQKVADFIGSPTHLVTEQLYPSKTYGTSMAPLFMNLTFWIGAFMLIVVMRQEVDPKGIERATLAQRFIGRYLLFAMMVVLQATICCLGLPVIGMEVESMPALIFAACVTALSYLSIIYSLSVSLQHIGKGICIVLVFAQIPAATGLYPIEMTAPFFQAIYPVLPFTYGISAMRESICGFYGMHYLHDMLALGAFLIAFMAAGIIARPYLSNVNRMVAQKIHESGIFVGEDVEVPIRRFKFSQVVRMLADKDEYRRELTERYERFEALYPKLIKGCIAVGIGVPVVFTIIFSLSMNEKIVLLTAWIAWILLVFLFLVTVESIKASIDRQLKLEGMSDDELRALYKSRNKTEKASVDE